MALTLTDYSIESDEGLARLAKYDNAAQDFLMRKYEGFVRAKSHSYFLAGADKEDVIQEGMIGLYKAIRDFKPDKGVFKWFAEMCVTRQIITAIKAATRQKHMPLNHYTSFDKPIYDDDRTFGETIGSMEYEPSRIVEIDELSDMLRERLTESLSDLERDVLLSYLEGESYERMARKLGTHTKSIDNALQRVRRKVQKTLDPDYEIEAENRKIAPTRKDANKRIAKPEDRPYEISIIYKEDAPKENIVESSPKPENLVFLNEYRESKITEEDRRIASMLSEHLGIDYDSIIAFRNGLMEFGRNGDRRNIIFSDAEQVTERYPEHYFFDTRETARILDIEPDEVESLVYGGNIGVIIFHIHKRDRKHIMIPESEIKYYLDNFSARREPYASTSSLSNSSEKCIA